MTGHIRAVDHDAGRKERVGDLDQTLVADVVADARADIRARAHEDPGAERHVPDRDRPVIDHVVADEGVFHRNARGKELPGNADQSVVAQIVADEGLVDQHPLAAGRAGRDDARAGDRHVMVDDIARVQRHKRGAGGNGDVLEGRRVHHVGAGQQGNHRSGQQEAASNRDRSFLEFPDRRRPRGGC